MGQTVEQLFKRKKWKELGEKYKGESIEGTTFAKLTKSELIGLAISLLVAKEREEAAKKAQKSRIIVPGEGAAQ